MEYHTFSYLVILDSPSATQESGTDTKPLYFLYMFMYAHLNT